MSWKAVAHSSLGINHQQQQLPCQDYGNFRLLSQDVIVGAVADGAGSAKYSDIGASLAVDTALDYFSNIDIGAFIRAFFVEQSEKMFARILNDWVLNRLSEEAFNQGYKLNDLACTLLIFIATPNWITAMQIGDGFLVVCPQDSDYQLLFQPDKGEFINETTFITSPNALEEMQVTVLLGQQELICAATDGLERVAIRLRDWTPFSPFFNPFKEYMKETDNPSENKEYLTSFLDSERLNAHTHDDKTMLLCLYEKVIPILPKVASN